MPARAPASMLMLHTVMRPSIESARMAEPRYSMTWPMPPPVPMRPMMARITSLAVTPAGSVAVDGDGHPAGPRLGQRLGGEDVLHLAGADAEGQRAEGAVGGGVGVAAHDGHARLGEALLGPDHVHDALARVAHRVEAEAELGGVAPHDLHLLGRDRVLDRQVDVGGGDVVVLGGDGEVGPAHRAAGQAQAVEGLRAGHLVDEVEVDVEEVGLARAGVDDVAVPDLLGQRGGRCHGSLPRSLHSLRLTSETLFSSRGHDCTQHRRAGQGRGRPRRPGPGRPPAGPGRAGGGVVAAPGHGLPHRRRPGGPRAGAARRRRPLRPRACAWWAWAGRRPRPSRWPTRPGRRCERLRDETGESVQLFVRSGEGRLCVESLESAHGLRWIVPVGAVLPLDRGSAGRVLSGVGGPVVESVEEREAGVASVSAAIHDRGGAVVAAVCVSGPVERLTRARRALRRRRARRAGHRAAGRRRSADRRRAPTRWSRCPPGTEPLASAGRLGAFRDRASGFPLGVAHTPVAWTT